MEAVFEILRFHRFETEWGSRHDTLSFQISDWIHSHLASSSPLSAKVLVHSWTQGVFSRQLLLLALQLLSGIRFPGIEVPSLFLFLFLSTPKPFCSFLSIFTSGPELTTAPILTHSSPSLLVLCTRSASCLERRELRYHLLLGFHSYNASRNCSQRLAIGWYYRRLLLNNFSLNFFPFFSSFAHSRFFLSNHAIDLWREFNSKPFRVVCGQAASQDKHAYIAAANSAFINCFLPRSIDLPEAELEYLPNISKLFQLTTEQETWSWSIFFEEALLSDPLWQRWANPSHILNPIMNT